MAFTFEKATRHKAMLRMALSGPSGSGKSYSALLIAQGLGGPIAAIDTERGSIRLYSHLCDFDVLELGPPFSPERFIEAIHAAEQHLGPGGTLIIDSTTHEWKGQGGVLEIVDMAARASRSGSSFNAWDSVTPRHQKFVDTIIQSKCHVIATMRAKAAYVQNQVNGKTKIEKVGTAPEQRDGFEFEFTAVLDLNNDQNIASASKDRTGLFRDPQVITIDTGRRLLAWLNQGETSQTPQPTPQPAQPTDRQRQGAQPPAGDPPPPPDARTEADGRLWKVAKEAADKHGLTAEQLKTGRANILEAEYGVRTAKDLSPEQIDRVTELLRKGPDAVAISVGALPAPAPAAVVEDDEDIPPFDPADEPQRTVDQETGEILAAASNEELQASEDPNAFADANSELLAAMKDAFPGMTPAKLRPLMERMACRRFKTEAFDKVTAAGRKILTQEVRDRKHDTLMLAQAEQQPA